jgi:transketolase
MLRSLDTPIVTVEDHWHEGGLGEAVVGALATQTHVPPVKRLAIREMPHSAHPEELLAEAGIDAAGIVRAARQLIQEKRGLAGAGRDRRGR